VCSWPPWQRVLLRLHASGGCDGSMTSTRRSLWTLGFRHSGAPCRTQQQPPPFTATSQIAPKSALAFSWSRVAITPRLLRTVLGHVLWGSGDTKPCNVSDELRAHSNARPHVVAVALASHEKHLRLHIGMEACMVVGALVAVIS